MPGPGPRAGSFTPTGTPTGAGSAANLNRTGKRWRTRGRERTGTRPRTRLSKVFRPEHRYIARLVADGRLGVHRPADLVLDPPLGAVLSRQGREPLRVAD